MRTEHCIVDGLEYLVRVAGQGPALVLLHGFTGSGDAWAPFMQRLAERWQVIVPDLPGHGGSGVLSAPFSLERCAADLTAILDRFGADEAVVVGYSLGGRTALTWAALEPRRVQALVLESASLGIASDAERAARREQDEVLARFIEENGVAAFVGRWERLPLFASQERLPEDTRRRIRERRLSQSAAGLAASLRTMGTGTMRPLYDDLPGLTLPTLLLVGELDEKYRRIAGDMAAVMPQATVNIIPDAGHAIHVERPDEWLRRVDKFLCKGSGDGLAY